jgi:Ca2+-binding EF-hand superfamily protein
VYKRLYDIKTPKKLQQHFLLMLVSLIDEQHFIENKLAFQKIDVDHSGLIDREELEKAMIKFIEEIDCGHLLNNLSIESLSHKLDFDGDGGISYSEFLACTLTRQHICDKNLQNLFRQLDIFGYNYLTKESLHKQFLRQGKQIPLEEVTAMMTELDIDAETQIDFKRFKKLII